MEDTDWLMRDQCEINSTNESPVEWEFYLQAFQAELPDFMDNISGTVDLKTVISKVNKDKLSIKQRKV